MGTVWANINPVAARSANPPANHFRAAIPSPIWCGFKGQAWRAACVNGRVVVTGLYQKQRFTSTKMFKNLVSMTGPPRGQMWYIRNSSPDGAVFVPRSRSFGFSSTTVVSGGTLSVSHTFDPTTDRAPITVWPPSTVALA